MVLVKFQGGLGNQLFQYAAARQISLKLNTPIYADLRYLAFPQNTPRSFLLHELALPIATLSDTDLESLAPRRFAKLRRHFAKYLRSRQPLRRIREKSSSNPAIFTITEPVYLDGYWQSYRYFEHISDVIRSDLRTLMECANMESKYKSDILESNSVAVHVRRGDYIANPKAAKFHGICSTGYYLRSFARMRAMSPDAHFYLFSDDRDWAAEHLLLDSGFTLVKSNDSSKPYVDLALFAHCKHAIIANSSFSWWGAWLINEQNSRIIAPGRWFKKRSMNLDCLPSHWITDPNNFN